MEHIVSALPLVFNIYTLAIAFIGVVLGIIIGALPGLSSTMGVALFIPVTYSMQPSTGLVFLGAIYMASTYGGSISAILLNTPGTPSAVITAIDGYELTKKGQSGEALSMATIASFIGGIISIIALMFISPPLSKLVIKFGAAEMFLLSILGLTIIVSLSKGSLVKGLIIGFAGMLFSVIGIDGITGQYRYTYDILSLFGGLSTVATVIGVYSTSQVFKLAAQKRSTIQYEYDSTKKLNIISLKEVIRNSFNFLRSSVIGTIVGILPGAGVSIASAIAYNASKSTSKHPETYGEGSMDGLAASEAANNAVVGGSLVPLLTLGIPGNTVSAIFLGGLVIHGLHPGPQLFTKHGNITYALFIGLFVATFLMLIVGVGGAKVFAKISIVSTNIIAPIIMALCVIGAFSVSNNEFNIYVMFAFGLFGLAMSELDFFMAPFVLGLVLGPITEQEFRRALLISKGNYKVFISSPISVFLVILIMSFLIYPYIRKKSKTK